MDACFRCLHIFQQTRDGIICKNLVRVIINKIQVFLQASHCPLLRCLHLFTENSAQFILNFLLWGKVNVVIWQRSVCRPFFSLSFYKD